MRYSGNKRARDGYGLRRGSVGVKGQALRTDLFCYHDDVPAVSLRFKSDLPAVVRGWTPEQQLKQATFLSYIVITKPRPARGNIQAIEAPKFLIVGGGKGPKRIYYTWREDSLLRRRGAH
jgi:hypothetical protein